MAFNEDLANRVREALAERTRFDEIKMFGGICFTVRGNMTLGVIKDDLMVRVGPDAHASSLKKPGARIMDFAKRPMVGFIYVDETGVKTKKALGGWADAALAFNATLPAKTAKKAKKR